MRAFPLASSSPGAPASRPLRRFGLVSAACALLWAVGMAYGLGSTSAFDELLCRQLAAGSAWGLRGLGWPAQVAPARPQLLLLSGQPSVIVGAACDGLVLYALLAGFVLAYPGPGRRRLWFIPLGIGALWLLNVFRIMALALNHRYSPTTFDFDHHYAFSAVAYAALGGLWLLWTRPARPAGRPYPPLAPTPAANALSAARVYKASPGWLTGRISLGLTLLASLVLLSIYQNVVVAALASGWRALLAAGPVWAPGLPGLPAGVSRLPLAVGAGFAALYLAVSLVSLHLLLPAPARQLVRRSYAGLLLAYGALLLLAGVSGHALAYRVARLLLDCTVSLLPVVGLLVLLWRRPAPAAAGVEGPQGGVGN